MLYYSGILLGGILLLYLGAEGLVQGGKRIGHAFGVSSLVVGLTIVAISTSMPEAVVSLLAQVREHNGDIAIGNVIGSNIANIGLILGVISLWRPQDTSIVCRRECPFMLMVTVALLVMMSKGCVLRGYGAMLLLGLAAYLIFEVYIARQDRRRAKEEREEKPLTGAALWKSLVISAIYVILGGVALVLGGNWLIDGAMWWARFIGVSDRIIGITAIALGTSLPELAASLVAMWRKDSDMAIGNVIGSVVFNILFVVGGVAVISPITFSEILFSHDAVVMLIFVVVSTVMACTGRRLVRSEGLILLAGYIVYLVTL